MKNKTRTISLRTIVALVLCLSIFFLSVLYIYQAYEGMKAGILSATQTTAQHLSEAVSQTIKATLLPPSVTLRLLRHDTITAAGNFQERLASLNLLQEALTSNPICSAVFIGYSTGDFFMLRKFSDSYPLVVAPAPEGTRYLLQTVTLQANGESLGELRFYGGIFNLLEHRILQDYKFDPRTRPWYKEAMLSDRVEITPPYIFFSTGQIGVTLAAKNILGDSVVGMDVTAEDISGLLSSVLITPATEIVIVDHTNKVLAYPQIDRLLIKEGDGYRLPQLTELGIPALDKLNVAGISENTLTEFHDGTRNWYGLMNPVSGFSTQEFKILIAIPSDELLAEAWKNLIRQVILAAAIMGAMILGGWRLGNRLVQPLHKLTVQVHSLAEFDFETPIGVATRVQEVRELGGVLANMAKTISGFQNLSLAMNKERNLERMLRAVLQQLLNIVQLESGAIYLYNEQDRVLKICVSQGGKAVAAISVSSAQATDEELIKKIQSQAGFDNILTILRNREQVLVGVLSIRCDDSNACLMNDALISFVSRIAGSAAVAIETRQLIQSQKALLDSIIKLVADAIDTKSRYTGAHCQRVPVLAIMIMDQIAQTQEPPFIGYTMTAIQREEFRIAAWLHDCGKITTPEYVVDKATKLETIYNRIHEVRMRFEVLHRDASIAYFEAVAGGADQEQAKRLRDAEHDRLQEDFAFIANCNIGGENMQPEELERLSHVAQKTWLRYFSDRLGLSREERTRVSKSPENATLPVVERLLADKESHIIPWGDRIPPVQIGDAGNIWGFDMKLPSQMYNYGEVYNLSIKKGTLTEEERFKINDHIVQTICMLSSLPLPKELSDIPKIAGNHHERMDGQGYPRKLRGEEMGIPEKVMAVADIFEALTASDRPYKEGKTLSQALTILSRMAKDRHVDKDIFNFFLRSGIYMNYAEQYLHPEQIDPIRNEDYLI